MNIRHTIFGLALQKFQISMIYRCESQVQVKIKKKRVHSKKGLLNDLLNDLLNNSPNEKLLNKRVY